MFRSHLLSMLAFASIVSILLASLKLDVPRAIIHQAARNFISLAGWTVVLSWIVRFL